MRLSLKFIESTAKEYTYTRDTTLDGTKPLSASGRKLLDDRLKDFISYLAAKQKSENAKSGMLALESAKKV